MSSIQTIQVHTAPAYAVSIGGGLLHTCGQCCRHYRSGEYPCSVEFHNVCLLYYVMG